MDIKSTLLGAGATVAVAGGLFFAVAASNADTVPTSVTTSPAVATTTAPAVTVAPTPTPEPVVTTQPAAPAATTPAPVAPAPAPVVEPAPVVAPAPAPAPADPAPAEPQQYHVTPLQPVNGLTATASTTDPNALVNAPPMSTGTGKH